MKKIHKSNQCFLMKTLQVIISTFPMTPSPKLQTDSLLQRNSIIIGKMAHKGKCSERRSLFTKFVGFYNINHIYKTVVEFDDRNQNEGYGGRRQRRFRCCV